MDSLPLKPTQRKNATETTFIYALADPDTMQVRYVGKSNNPQQRLKDHLWCKQDTHKTRWINVLKSQGKVPGLIILEEVPASQWEEKERYWIAFYREQGANLTNATSGGDGAHDIQRSPETCALISKIHTGMTKTPEQRSAQSALYKELGIRPPQGVHERLSRQLKGKPVDPDVLAKKRETLRAKKEAGIRRKPVVVSDSLREKRKAYMTEYWEGERSQGNRASLTNERAAIIKFNAYDLTQKEYSEMFGISCASISAIVCGMRYKHITREHLPTDFREINNAPTLSVGRDSRGRRLPKLTDEQAAIIKFDVYGLTHKEYANLFGVSGATVSVIRNGHFYQHVTLDCLPEALREGGLS